MDEDKSLLALIVSGLVALGSTIFTLVLRRDVAKFDRALDRIGELERSMVTRKELDERLVELHKENRERLTRIESKLDERDLRDQEVRHDIRGIAQSALLKASLALEVARNGRSPDA